MMKKFVILSFVCLLPACTSSVSTQPRPTGYYEEQTRSENRTDQLSLFKSDKEVLSDEDIAKILEYPFRVPSQSRVAILPIGQRSWGGWSDEVTQLNDNIETEFIQVLRSSRFIYDASYLPSLLVPERRSVPYLREAAARYQADLLLMYRAECHQYEKYRLFSADETKAYCTVEAVVLDTRSGIIPFTSVATEEYSAKETKEDFNLLETIHKAEMQAIGSALSTIAKEFVAFLETSSKP